MVITRIFFSCLLWFSGRFQCKYSCQADVNFRSHTMKYIYIYMFWTYNPINHKIIPDFQASPICIEVSNKVARREKESRFTKVLVSSRANAEQTHKLDLEAAAGNNVGVDKKWNTVGKRIGEITKVCILCWCEMCLNGKHWSWVPRGFRPILIVDKAPNCVVERVAPIVNASTTLHIVERYATKYKLYTNMEIWNQVYTNTFSRHMPTKYSIMD